MSAPIFLITGPPGAGKTTLSQALLQRFEFGFHLEVDALRLGVAQGLADSVPWTDQTERQFQIAEAATCDVAKRYQDAGFAVAIDHCRNLVRLDELAEGELAGRDVTKVCLLPDLEVNLLRNAKRTNKSFDPSVLSETIRFTNRTFVNQSTQATNWVVIDNSFLTIDATVDQIWPQSSLIN